MMTRRAGRTSVGHPVDVASGVMFCDHGDLNLRGRPPLLFSRYYSTALALEDLEAGSGGALGLGFRHNLQYTLRETVDGYALTTPEGDEVPFEHPSYALSTKPDGGTGNGTASGRLPILNVGAAMELVPRPSDEVALVQYQQGAYPFTLVFSPLPSSAGQPRQWALGAVERTPHARVLLHWDGPDRLVGLTHTRTGRSLELDYNADGLVERVGYADNVPTEVRYRYDPRGRLSEVGGPQGMVGRYEYDEQSRIRAEVRHTGQVYTFSYDSQGRCIHTSGVAGYQERWMHYDDVGRRTQVRDSRGHWTVYEYNEAGQTTVMQTPRGARWCYGFDDLGRPTQVVDPLGAATLSEYDALGHLVAVVMPDGRRLGVEYDAKHLPIRIENLAGQVLRCIYDDQGELCQTVDEAGRTWRYRVNDYGELTKVTNCRGESCHFYYDKRGDLVSYHDWAGGVWSSQYDSFGRFQASVDPTGGRLEVAHDALGRVSQTKLPGGQVWSFAYDRAGRLSHYQAPDGSTNTYEFDACGKVLRATDALGETVSISWSTEPGLLESMEDQLGRRYALEYNEDGLVTRQRYWDGRVTRYEYDLAGNCTAQTEAGGRRTEYEYNVLGLLVLRRDHDGGETHYEYGPHGELVCIADDNSVVRFERDHLGRIVAEQQDEHRVTSEYDDLGRRVTLSTSNGTKLGYSWGPNGDCWGIGTAAGRIRLERDAVGRETRRELPSGGALTSSYDAAGRIAEQAFRPGKGGSAQLSRETTQISFARKYAYDEFGRINEIEEAPGEQQSLIHDAEGQLVGLRKERGLSEVFQFDPAGNRLWRASFEDSEQATPIWEKLSGEGKVSPKEMLGSGASLTELNYSDANHHVASWCASNDGRAHHFSCHYDEAGFLVRRIDEREQAQKQEWTYEWDARGQLRGVGLPDGQHWKYRYDGLGRRIEKIAPDGASTRYIWDGEVVIEVVQDAQVVLGVEYEPKSAQPARITSHGKSYYVLPTPNATLRTVVQEDDGVLSLADGRTSFGTPRPAGGGQRESNLEAPAGPNIPLALAGQWIDEETGLHYNLYRYLDPETNAFISPDPVSVSSSLNEYRGIRCPFNWLDLNGLLEELNYHKQGGEAPVYQGGAGTANIRASHPQAPDGEGSYYVGSRSGGKTVALVSTGSPRATPGSTYAFPSGALQGASPTSTAAGMFDQDFLNACNNVAFQNGGIGNGHHAEIHAFHYVWRNPQAFAGQTIYVHITRTPCNSNRVDHGNGTCWHTVADLADATVNRLRKVDPNTRIVVTYSEANNQRRRIPFHDTGC